LSIVLRVLEEVHQQVLVRLVQWNFVHKAKLALDGGLKVLSGFGPTQRRQAAFARSTLDFGKQMLMIVRFGAEDKMELQCFSKRMCGALLAKPSSTIVRFSWDVPGGSSPTAAWTHCVRSRSLSGRPVGRSPRGERDDDPMIGIDHRRG